VIGRGHGEAEIVTVAVDGYRRERGANMDRTAAAQRRSALSVPPSEPGPA
jgi:hypothetical protein